MIKRTDLIFLSSFGDVLVLSSLVLVFESVLGHNLLIVSKAIPFWGGTHLYTLANLWVSTCEKHEHQIIQYYLNRLKEKKLFRYKFLTTYSPSIHVAPGGPSDKIPPFLHSNIIWRFVFTLVTYGL